MLLVSYSTLAKQKSRLRHKPCNRRRAPINTVRDDPEQLWLWPIAWPWTVGKRQEAAPYTN